jgi:hypothetical protein
MLLAKYLIFNTGLNNILQILSYFLEQITRGSAYKS